MKLISAKAAEHQWGLCRGKFSRERKAMEKPSGAGNTSTKKWELFDRMSFLNEHVKRRRYLSTSF